MTKNQNQINKFVNLLSNNGKKSNSYKLLLKSLAFSKFKIFSNTSAITFPGSVSTEFSHSNVAPVRSAPVLGAFAPSTSHIREVVTLKESNKNTLNITNQALRSAKLIYREGARREGVTYHKFEERKHCKLFFHQAIERVKPSVETRKVRVGGAIYQVPSIIHNLRQEGIAMRWLIMSASTKKSSSQLDFSNRLAQELLDSFQKQGQNRQKRDQIHILAANNRAYARYRWW